MKQEHSSLVKAVNEQSQIRKDMQQTCLSLISLNKLCPAQLRLLGNASCKSRSEHKLYKPGCALNEIPEMDANPHHHSEEYRPRPMVEHNWGKLYQLLADPEQVSIGTSFVLLHPRVDPDHHYE